MEPLIIILIGTILSGAVAAFTYNNKKRKIKTILRKAPFKRIENVLEGETVTIAGNVVFYKRFITAPLSERECIYYRATVERNKNSGKSSNWTKEIDEVASVDFILDDGSMIAIVEANAVEGYLEMDKNFRSGKFNSPTPILETFLNKYKFTSKGIFGINKNMRYKEGALEKHEYCVVCGTCFWEKAADHAIENVDQVLVIKATPGNPVYISDVKDILI